MNKHNTEGYVLAYLLVAITVIGLVASALMASTLKVVQAQELSLQKTQSKYAVQGELERFLADLDFVYPSPSISSSYYSDKDTASDSAINSFVSFLNTLNLDTYPLIEPDSLLAEYSSENNTISMSMELSDSLSTISTTFSFAPDLVFDSKTVTDVEENPSTPEIELKQHTEFSCSVVGASTFAITAYKITSTGGGT